jgi:ArsR family transcriptional regulator
MNDRITETTNIFKALGDPTRLKLLGLMLGTERLCVGMLANKLGITQSAVSQHLKLLKHVELVTFERVGFHMHYSVNMNTIKKYKLDIKTIFGVSAERAKCIVCPKEIQTKK